MKRTKWLVGMVPVALLAASTAWAATDASLNPNFSSGAAATGVPASDLAGAQYDGAFGLGSQDFWVGASQFYPRSANNSLVYNGLYYWYSTGGQHEAQFQLPNGSNMSVFRCFFNDVSVANDGNVGLWRQYFDTTANSPNVVNITSVASTGSAGYQSAFTSPNATFLSRSGTSSEQLNMYTMIANLPAGDSQVSLRGCRVFYNRQIAPAPATATFSDVPVGSQFFAEVEALANSGITAGCTASAYCPGNNVTRLQMAAFLARALGLHWPPF